MGARRVLSVITLCCLLAWGASAGAAGPPGVKTYGPAWRVDKAGWIYVHIEGEPFERGKQYGYLVAKDYQAILEATKYMTYQTMGMPYEFFVQQSAKLNKGKIPEELLQEMAGFAAGCREAGVPATLEEIIAWNAWDALTGYWWLSHGYKQFRDKAPKGRSKGHCSAFIATGDATTDGKIVIGHTTFEEFWTAGMGNVLLDLVPTKGHRIFMQTAPGYVMSMSDFFMLGSGLVGLETTIIEIDTYDLKGIPEWVRVRQAMQYADDIDGFIRIMQKGNNGDNASSWLIGDTRTNEICRFEQGYLYQSVTKKNNGYFFGCNAVEDPRIRNLECTGVGYNDIRRQTGGRRVRLTQLLDKHYGKIDAVVGKGILADTWDVYHKQDRGGANTICAMYDIDPRKNFSSSTGCWPDPYTPAGSLDGKVATSAMVKAMTMLARMGRANGVPFNAAQFLKEHPQWAWQKPYLPDMPSQPYVLFKAGVRPE